MLYPVELRGHGPLYFRVFPKEFAEAKDARYCEYMIIQKLRDGKVVAEWPKRKPLSACGEFISNDSKTGTDSKQPHSETFAEHFIWVVMPLPLEHNL